MNKLTLIALVSASVSVVSFVGLTTLGESKPEIVDSTVRDYNVVDAEVQPHGQSTLVFLQDAETGKMLYSYISPNLCKFPVIKSAIGDRVTTVVNLLSNNGEQYVEIDDLAFCRLLINQSGISDTTIFQEESETF